MTQPALRGLRELGGVGHAVLSRLADEPPPRLARISLREHHTALRSAEKRDLLARFPALRHLELDGSREPAKVARELDQYVPRGLEELHLVTESDELAAAATSAQRTALSRFVYTYERVDRARVRLAFSPAEDGRLSVLTVEACEGAAADDWAVQCLDALPEALVSRATDHDPHHYAPRVRYALRRFQRD